MCQRIFDTYADAICHLQLHIQCGWKRKVIVRTALDEFLQIHNRRVAVERE
jgi:hypothetical protein